jgi:peptide/nickel transport system substrate-binding protein
MHKKPPALNIPIFRRDFIRNSALAGVAAGLPGLTWAVRGEELHISNYNEIVTLDPTFSVSGAEGIVARAIFQNLLQIKNDGTWDTELDAAEYFEQLDDTRFAFRLKPGQMFSNGFGEMTTDDVKFSFERMVDPKVSALNAIDLGPFSHVEVHDRYSGTLVLNSPYGAFVKVAVAFGSGAIMSRKAVESVGGKFSVIPPSCSGPYLFKSWQAKRKTVLERNPLWTGDKPAFSEIHIYPMTDTKSGEMAFEAGQLDTAEISVESVEAFKKNMPPNSRLETQQSGRSYWLGMNMDNPALQDIRVRQAIQYGVDVEAILEAAWFGLAEPSTGPIPENIVGHRPKGLIPPKGDINKAKALLKEAGVKLPLHLTLNTNSDSLELTAVQVIQWSLKKIGIEVEIIAQDNNTFLNIGFESKGDQWQDVQLFFQSFIGGPDPYYSIVWFVTEQVGQWNWERFSSEEFDSLNAAAMATSDYDERDRMYRRAQDVMEESGCFRWVTNGVMSFLVRNTIQPAFRPDGYPLLRGFKLKDSGT